MTPEEQEYIKSSSYSDALKKYLNSGVSQFMWDYVMDPKLTQEISLPCRDHLLSVAEGVKKGIHPEFMKIVAASGRLPDKFFAGGITSLGDYDTCLSLKKNGLPFNGKYCLVDLFAPRNRPEALEEPNFLMDNVMSKSFQNYSFFQGICIPDSCSNEDVRVLMANSMRPVLLKPNGLINCDTKETISLIYRIKNMSIHQLVSLIGILSMLSLVGLGSALHVLNLLIQGNKITSFETLESMLHHQEQGFMARHFSIISNGLKLFKPSSQTDNRYLIIDFFKLALVISGCWAHALVCVEIPTGHNMLGGHEFLKNIASSPYFQIMLNDSGLVMFAFLGGFATFMMVYPMMKQMHKDRKSFPFGFAIFDRWLRFTPSIMSLVALEFTWALVFDGPFYTRVSSFVKDKCQRTWYHNLFFVQNWFPVLDICGGQTFFSAVDLQLFIIGLIILHIMISKSRTNAFLIMFCLSVLASLKVIYNSFLHELTMTMYTPKMDATKILEYLNYVHMTTPVYIPSYFIGMINGLIIHSGFKFPTQSLKHHLFFLYLVLTLPYGSTIVTSLYNGFDMFPQFLVPFAIMGNRIFQSISCAISLTYFMSIDSKWTMFAPSTNSKYSFMQALCRLSYALYLVNYFVVKTEFFTSRTVFPLTWSMVVSRLLSSSVYMMLASVVFHLVIVAPLITCGGLSCLK